VTRINVVVEGATEESFIKNLLAVALWPKQVYLQAFLIGARGHKGGNVSYARVKRDVAGVLKQDAHVYCSTMFDLYGLRRDFPGMPLPDNTSGLEKVERLEKAMYETSAGICRASGQISDSFHTSSRTNTKPFCLATSMQWRASCVSPESKLCYRV
jgi:hypothetical protein